MMPLYEYYDPETNVRVELRRSVDDRNKDIVLKRVTDVPERLHVHVHGQTASQQFDADILRGYYQKEQRDGSRFQSSFTKEQIKDAWKE